MSIATVIATIEDDARRLLEEHLPAVKTGVADAEAVLSEPFIAAYTGSALKVPEHLVNLALDFLTKLVGASQAAPAPVAAPTDGPVGVDAETAPA